MAETQPVDGATPARYIDDRAEIAGVFRTFRDLRAALSVRFEGEARSFTARILDVDIGHFLLDDIKPRDGLRLLHKRVPFTFTGRTDGMYLFAEELEVSQADSERGVPYFLVPFPRRLLAQQRRRAARFRLPLSVSTKGAAVHIEREDGVHVGRIIDISAGGCRAEFGLPSPPFAANESLKQLQIVVPNLLELSAQGTIRHHALLTEQRVSCGIEFGSMEVADRRRLGTVHSTHHRRFHWPSGRARLDSFCAVVLASRLMNPASARRASVRGPHNHYTGEISLSTHWTLFMPHQFTAADSESLAGIWFKANGRRYCHWKFDADSSTLHAARGVVKRSRVVSLDRPLDEFKDELPKLALELAATVPH
ncbi:MAG: hypothetical protein HC809_06445 [Gammaproteobacteria bacterium]|nr:hypothetical protein [Gammaproteobacteria bacterium]